MMASLDLFSPRHMGKADPALAARHDWDDPQRPIARGVSLGIA
jgi:hypothetical protein